MNFAPVTRLLGKVGLGIRSHSPAILMIAGGVTFITTIVSACKDTPKAVKVLEQHNEELAAIKEAEAKVKSGELPITAFNKADARNDIVACYIRTGGKLVKTYWKTILLGGVSLACFGGAAHILTERVASATALAGTYLKDKVSLENAIINDPTMGPEKLEQLRKGQIEHVPIETHEDPETGETVVDKEKLVSMEAHTLFFDESHPRFQKDVRENFKYLWSKENYLNHVFFHRGWIFKNQEIDLLGFPETEQTQDGFDVGNKFYKDPKEAQRHGADNFVSIGINPLHLPYDEALAWFVAKHGEDPVIMLKLNVDRDQIKDKIGRKKS